MTHDTSRVRPCSLALGASVLALLAASPGQAQATGPTPDAPGAQSGTTRSAKTADQPASGDIVVTAQRQAQTLQSVPIAITAFTAEALQAQQVETTEDLQLYLPNITYTRTNFSGGSFAVRGIGDLAVGASSDTSIGLHFNDLPLIRTRIADQEYFDLERVEVLRGPQGTLFGRNATGGVVNYISARPDLNRISGQVIGEYANYDHYKVQGFVNLPLADWVGVRVAGYYLNRNGFTRNLFDGSRIDGRDSWSVRGTIRIEPGPDTTLDVIGSYFRERSDRSKIQKQLCNQDPTGVLGCLPDRLEFETINANSTLAGTAASQEFFRIATGNPAFGAFGLSSIYGPSLFSTASNPRDLRNVSVDFNPRYRSRDLLVMARLSHDFGRAALTVTGGYQEERRRALTDYNLTAGDPIAGNAGVGFYRAFPLLDPAEAILFNGGNIGVSAANRTYVGYIGNQIERFAPRTTEYDDDRGGGDAWSVEAHLDSKLDGPFNFLLGGIYLQSTVDTDYFVAASALDYTSSVLGALNGFGATGNPAFGLTSPIFNNELTRYRLKAWAAFGEAYLQATDTLKFTAGLRYTVDDKETRDRQGPLLTGGIAPLGTESISDQIPFRDNQVRFKRLTGRAVVDWQPTLSFTDQTLVYASYSRGYKAGGINPAFDPRLFQVQAAFRPETINAFEIGNKNRFGNGAFQANLAAFYYDYKDLQVSRIINRTSFNENVNAEVYGVEGEFVLTPTRNLQFNINASLLKTEIKDFATVDPRDPSAGRDDTIIVKDILNAANCVVAPAAAGVPRADALVGGFNAAVGLRGTTPVPGTATTGAYSICAQLGQFIAANGLPYQVSLPVGASRTAAPGGIGFLPITDPAVLAAVGLPSGIDTDVGGNQLPGSPSFKISIGGQYTFELPGGLSLVTRADYAFTGEYYGRIFNRNPIDRIPSYDVVNLAVTLNGRDERWFVRGFVQNLEGDDSITGLYVTDPASGLFTNVFSLDPRRYGVTAGFRF